MKNDIPIYAIDFEGSKSLGIVEFGIVGIKDNEIFAAETAICAPLSEISKRDADFFGITNEYASSQQAFEVHSELFSHLRANGIFASHSASVENSLLRFHIASPGKVKNHFTNSETLTWAPWLDSRKLAKFLNPKLKSEKLSDVVSALNLDDELSAYAKKMCPKNRAKWHCALYDALASALIIKHALPFISGTHELAELCGEDCFTLF